MPNFTLSEILTIALVILIVFGPQRLPEMARKAGELIRKARTMTTDLRREFEGEFQDVAQPLKEVGDELKGVREEVGASMASLSDDVAQAKKEVEEELATTNEEVEDTLAAPNGSSDEAVTPGQSQETPPARDESAEAGPNEDGSEKEGDH